MKDGNRVVVLGLRRSGTTIFWRTLRQDQRFVCYDEPFNPYIRNIPMKDKKDTWGELVGMFQRDPGGFWRRFSPIYDLQELEPDLTDGQAHWLGHLLESAPCLAMDFTRCHLKLSSLHVIIPDAYVVHLYRRAGSFASSHLIPSGGHANGMSRWKGYLKRAYCRKTFWTRYKHYDFWDVENIFGRHPQSRFGCLLQEAGFDVEVIMRSPAVVRLLAYWLFHYRKLESEGPSLWGHRFRSVAFEDFAAHPHEVLKDLYQRMTLPCPDWDFTEVRPAAQAFRAGDKRWREASKIAGFSSDEADRLL